jgi:hypothetical protein
LVVGGDASLVEGDGARVSAALESSPSLGAVDEDVSHGERRQGQKMRPIAGLGP